MNSTGSNIKKYTLKLVFGIPGKLNRSSFPDVFYKKGALKSFAKFTGKQLCQSLFFNKVAGLRLF